MNDYLWDKSGPPDAEIERLERLLGRFAAVPAMPAIDRRLARWRSLRIAGPILATAAAVILIVAAAARGPLALWPGQPSASWSVSAVSGQPRIGRTAVTSEGRLAVGDTLVTDVDARARLEVGKIGEVTVEPNTRVRLVAARSEHHRLALDRGTVRAFILAPPGQFVVDTPSATAVDLGCAYTLKVDEKGVGLLSVEVGWVGFEWNGRESFVPAGASCPTRPRLGPGTPRYDDADASLKAALDAIDFAGPRQDRAGALATIVERARAKDGVTLWHLLARVHPSEREVVYTALAARVPPPRGVTRDAVQRLDRAALDAWWDALGLGNTAFWRKWKGNPF